MFFNASCITFCIGRSSLGVMCLWVTSIPTGALHKRIGALRLMKSNANTLVRAGVYRVFLTSCVGINLRDNPQGMRHPRGVPSVHPSTLGRNIPIHHSPPSNIVAIQRITLLRSSKEFNDMWSKSANPMFYCIHPSTQTQTRQSHT